MHYFLENETDTVFEFDTQEIIRLIVDEVLDMEGCDYEAQVNVILTDNEGIKAVNKECRDIDRETDVLSFPALEANKTKVSAKKYPSDVNPESGRVVLGEIIICEKRAIEQSKEYGHSIERELGFLCAHGMLHLFGYDHMEEDDEKQMRSAQNEILEKIGLTR